MIAVETPIDPITKKPDYQALCAEVIIHDPWIAEYQGDLLERAMGCGVAILMVKQQAYYAIDLAALRNVLRTPILIDGRHMFEPSQAQTVDLIYWAKAQNR